MNINDLGYFGDKIVFSADGKNIRPQNGYIFTDYIDGEDIAGFKWYDNIEVSDEIPYFRVIDYNKMEQYYKKYQKTVK